MKSTEPKSIGEALAKSSIPALTSQPVGNDRAARWEAEERDREERAKTVRRSACWKALVESRGQRYADARLTNFEATTPAQREALEKLTAYAADIDGHAAAGRNVLFLGPVGTGKDHLAFALCRAAIAAFKTVVWTNGVALWAKYRKAISGENGHAGVYCDLPSSTFDGSLQGDELDVCRQLGKFDVLAISDPIPPAGALTEYQTAMLFDVIDRRYSHLRPTIVTLNCSSRTEAEQRIGAQTVDRLCHDALVITCNWPSYRQRKQTGEGSSK